MKRRLLWLFGYRRGVTDYGAISRISWRELLSVIRWDLVHNNPLLRRRR